jgi:RNA polymerase sigma-70 factor, ECF subfamily
MFPIVARAIGGMRLALPAGMPSPSCAYADLPVFGAAPAGAALPAGEDRPALSRFAEVVRSNQARILRLATGMLRDRDVAEDVAQETFVRAFRFYGSFRSESALSTWLYRIAVNLCIDAQRKQARTERLADDDERAEQPDPSPPPDRALEVRELARHAEAALETLSADHKAVLILREVEGLSYAEIARILRIPKGTVMSRLFHARSNLQRSAHALAG